MKESRTERLVIDGNSFYEIDLQCMEQKRRKRSTGSHSPGISSGHKNPGNSKRQRD